MILQPVVKKSALNLNKIEQNNKFNRVFWNPRYESIHNHESIQVKKPNPIVTGLFVLLTVAVVWFIMFMVFIIF
jgi:hypothetical protein